MDSPPLYADADLIAVIMSFPSA